MEPDPEGTVKTNWKKITERVIKCMKAFKDPMSVMWSSSVWLTDMLLPWAVSHISLQKRAKHFFFKFLLSVSVYAIIQTDMLAAYCMRLCCHATSTTTKCQHFCFYSVCREACHHTFKLRHGNHVLVYFFHRQRKREFISPH